MKTKIKSDGDEVTDFYDKEIRKVDSNRTCLAVISLDSALRKDENYYLSLNTFKKKVIRHIKKELSQFSSSDESDEETIGVD